MHEEMETVELEAVASPPDIAGMTDGEKLTELLVTMRAIGAIAKDVGPAVLPQIDKLMNSPMFKAMGRLM